MKLQKVKQLLNDFKIPYSLLVQESSDKFSIKGLKTNTALNKDRLLFAGFNATVSFGSIVFFELIK